MDQDLPVSTRGLVAAKPRKRPQSRASTTSVRSAATQPNMDHGSFVGVSNMYAGQWINGDHGHAKNISVPPHLSAEDLILQAASHMQSASADFHMSAPMSAHTHMAYQRQPTMPRHPLPADQYAHGNASFAESDSQMLDRDDNEDGESMVGNAGPPRPAASRSSANNELEMRQLFSANRHRRLQDVASELHGNERGPNSERTRQVFAMLWINSACTKGKCSVPRGRVYAHYASRCATERITVLNPASFGKLVRVLFPGLKTRRLGVRGESKYHYVNFAIVDDQPEARESQPPVSRPLSEGHGLVHPIKNTSSTQSARIASHDPPPSALSVSPNQQTSVRKARSSGMTHSLYNMPNLASIGHAHTTSAKTQLELAFPSTAGPDIQQLEPLALPPIEAYLPQGTDVDAAKSLSALYRSHCTSLVECIRYCHEKTYFHLYTSFQGTLTMPVQKLFGHAALAAWIEGCDYALYQCMMSIIAGLTLQVVPKPVLDTLRSISERLVPHIRESFQGQPQHVLAAKEAPAAVFAGLLDRALRVNLTAHAAANMLSNPANRDQMYVDWITMIRARKIAECVPTRSMDDLVDLLVAEMRDLLDPVNVPWEVECLTIYGDAASRSGRQASSNSDGDASGHNVLDRWVSFLQELPEKFPYASHTEIVWCVERVGTAVMRDLTLAQGKSFGSWWVTKTWVDEMIRFLAEQGGFMKQKTRQPNRSVSLNTEERIQKTTNRHKSRCSSQRSSSASSTGSDELNTTNITKAQPERAPFPAPLAAAQGSTQAGTGAGGGDPHDDSGIGIRTPEEEFAMNKFGFTTADNMNMVVGTGLTTA